MFSHLETALYETVAVKGSATATVSGVTTNGQVFYRLLAEICQPTLSILRLNLLDDFGTHTGLALFVYNEAVRVVS